MSDTLPLALDGYTHLPKGKVAVTVTYLEMLSRPEISLPSRTDLTLEPWTRPELDAYRALFRSVGQDWLWFARLKLSDDELRSVLDDPARAHFVPYLNGKPAGMLELDFSDPETPELAYFGLVPEAIGGGAGRWLMAKALELVWSRPQTKRLWVHTCTADSQKALDFYKRSGFTPYKLAIEVDEDPRLSGLLPRSAAPHVPIIE
ncbi:GNAT family N-acetyltransferase [Roseibium litorale]|uniref:GNAT family N-acetyltransferase n=1 Tax=Roseibium litorale TaxID=2803841 RepID=A0ABR9CLC2_9HYPH|nr:GNAT family N-acetyltransferase [Roseibium litorale]MBD8891344.1 GNAT family N-acetyltransferase [Roseibium litorale]